MRKLFFFLLCVFYPTMCMAKVIVAGLTVPIDIAEIEKQTATSEHEAKVLAIALTNKLHESGYTTSYVQRYHLDGDVCYLYVVESHIADIQLVADYSIKESIMQDLHKLQGEVYNRKAVHAFLIQLKEKYILDSIQVDVENYNDGDDVSLIIRVRAKGLIWSFEVTTLPIYGVTPTIALSMPLYKAIITGQGQIGFNDEMVTLKKGVIEYMSYRSKIGCHTGLQVSDEYAVWERYSADFMKTSVRPFVGIGLFHNSGVFDISTFIYGVSTYYRVSEQNPVLLGDTYKDAGIELRIQAKDGRSIAKKNRILYATLFSGLSQDKYLVTTRSSIYVPVQFTSRFYAIPSWYSFYTNSNNRIYAEYVFDSYLGYSSRYTATQSRSIGKLEIMYEALYELVFVEVFGCFGVYKTEYNRWQTTSSYGLGADVTYNRILFNVGCAWNTDEKFSQYYIFSSVRAQL